MAANAPISLPDRELLDSLEVLPQAAIERVAEHIRSGGRMSAAYGWPEAADQYAQIGCLAGIGLTRDEFWKLRSTADGDDANYLCQTLFSKFAAQWVEDLDAELPEEAMARLLHLLERELERRQRAARRAG